MKRLARVLAAAAAALAVAAAAVQPTLVVPATRSAFPQPLYEIPAGPRVLPFEPAFLIPRGVEFADFNGDGLLDIVLNPGFAQHLPVLPIQVWLNNGDGSFRDATAELFDGPAPLVWNAQQLLVGDFNRDGRPDVFFLNSGPELDGTNYPNSLILSQPNGKYVDATARIPNNAPAYNHQGGIADANGDGLLDVVVNAQPGNFGHSRGIKIYYGDGTGGFGDATGRLPAEVRWMPDSERPGDLVEPLFDFQDVGCATLADVDGDGIAEVLTGSYSRPDRNDRGGTRTVRIHKLQPSGNYAEVARLPIPAAIADVPFGYEPPPPFFAGLGCSQIVAGDLHGTGRVDLLVQWEGNGKAYAQLLRNDGGLHFTDVTVAALGGYSQSFLDAGAPMGPGHYRLADINGDGLLDIVAQLGGTTAAGIAGHMAQLNDGNGRFTPWAPLGPGGALTAADLVAGARCSTCRYLPLLFDTNNSGVASLVLLDYQSSVTNTTPSQTATLYLTTFAPTARNRTERLFDWAQAQFPALFPGPAATFRLAGFNVRAYPGGVYLGEANGEVYVYGPPFGGLRRVGSLAGFLPLAAAAGF